MDVLVGEARRRLGERRARLIERGAEDRTELDEVEAALARIAAGTYGFCEVCGTALGRQRLRAIPELRRCLGCESPSGTVQNV